MSSDLANWAWPSCACLFSHGALPSCSCANGHPFRLIHVPVLSNIDMRLRQLVQRHRCGSRVYSGPRRQNARPPETRRQCLRGESCRQLGCRFWRHWFRRQLVTPASCIAEVTSRSSWNTDIRAKWRCNEPFALVMLANNAQIVDALPRCPFLRLVGGQRKSVTPQGVDLITFESKGHCATIMLRTQGGHATVAHDVWAGACRGV